METLAGYGLTDLYAIAVVTLLAVVPGLFVLLAARVRGWALAASPAVTFGVVSWSTSAASALGLRWSLATMAAATVLTAAVAGAAAWLLRQRTPAAPEGWLRTDWYALAVAAVAAVVGALPLLVAMGDLGAIHQDYDATFHAAAVRSIGETGLAAPQDLAGINERHAADTFFYPDAWHATAALALHLGVDSVPAIVNSGILSVALLAPFGVAGLLVRFTGSRLLAGASAALIPALSAYTFDLVWRGPLIPYAVGAALVPAFLLLLTEYLRNGRAGYAVATGVAAAGILGLHPSVVFNVVIFAVPLLVQRWVTRRGAISADLRRLAGALLVAAVVGLPSLIGSLTTASSGSTFDWPATQNPGQAVGEALLLNHARISPQWAIALLALVGVASWRRARQLIWLWVGGLIFLALFVIAGAYEGPWVETLTGPWWNDRWRFMAFVALVVAVLAALGATVLIDRGAALARSTRLRGDWGTAAAAGLLVVVFGITSGGWYLQENAQRSRGNWRDANVVSDDDIAVFEQMAEIVPEGELVMNDPVDGSPWMYAIAGVRPYFGHVVTPAVNPDPPRNWELFLGHFDEIDERRDVRAAAEELGINYVFVSDDEENNMHGAPQSDGFDELDDSQAFELVLEVGEARLYELVG